jgi:hypothetical protein
LILRVAALPVLALAMAANAALARQPDSCHGYSLVLPFAVVEPTCNDDVCALQDPVVTHTYSQWCERPSVARLPTADPGKTQPRIDMVVNIETIAPWEFAQPGDRDAVTDFVLRQELRPFLRITEEYSATSVEPLADSALPFRCRWVDRLEHDATPAMRHLGCAAIDGDRVVTVHAEMPVDASAERDALLAALKRMHRLDDSP